MSVLLTNIICVNSFSSSLYSTGGPANLHPREEVSVRNVRRLLCTSRLICKVGNTPTTSLFCSSLCFNRIQIQSRVFHLSSTSIAEQEEPRDRMVQVVKWYLSAFHAGRKGSVAKKPYNPILGEVFYCHWDLPTEVEEPPPPTVRPHASVENTTTYKTSLSTL